MPGFDQAGDPQKARPNIQGQRLKLRLNVGIQEFNAPTHLDNIPWMVCFSSIRIQHKHPHPALRATLSRATRGRFCVSQSAAFGGAVEGFKPSPVRREKVPRSGG